MHRLLAAAALIAVCPLAAQNPNWTRPFEGHRVIGNLYYVGTYDLACYLITGADGHILINTGLEESAGSIRRSVESLGFQYEDIKILLTMQAHWDHVAAMAKIQEETGAQVFATAEDAKLLESGGFSDWRFGGKQLYEPVGVDRILEHGAMIRLGDTELRVVSTPGHTTGSSSYAMEVSEGGKMYNVFVANMNTINPGVTFVGNKKYPRIIDDFALCFERQKAEKVDIWVAAHASQFGLHDKYQPGDSYNPERFVDRDGYKAAVSRYEKLYLDQLTAERAQ